MFTSEESLTADAQDGEVPGGNPAAVPGETPSGQTDQASADLAETPAEQPAASSDSPPGGTVTQPSSNPVAEESATAPPPSTSTENASPPPPEVKPLPADPPVSVNCQGISDACSAVRTELQKALEKAGLPLVREPDAEIVIMVNAEEIESRTDTQFGTTFVIRTYSIDVTGDASRFGEMVSMPPPQTVSFDTRFGREKLNESSRVLASGVSSKIREYWSRKIQ